MVSQLIERPLYTVEQARRYLGIGRATLYRLLGRRELASVHGRARRIRQEDLEKFVEQSLARDRTA